MYILTILNRYSDAQTDAENFYPGMKWELFPILFSGLAFKDYAYAI